MDIILASASPRRKQLLKEMGIRFKVVKPDVAEVINKKCSVKEMAVRLALRKARDVAKKVEGKLVLGADTLVVCGREIVGKPKDIADSKRILRKLSGSKHKVITGIALIDQVRNKTTTMFDESFVLFRKIPEKEIDKLAKKHMDKAGAYAVQSKKDRFAKKVIGSYNNVVGLPTEKLRKMLDKAELRQSSATTALADRRRVDESE